MNTAELNNLETQIDSLIRTIEQLKVENFELKQKLNKLISERNRLQELNQQAAGKIKQIISQLKEEAS